MKTFIAISMTVMALGLVACGDDNDDSAQDTGAQTTTGTTTGSTTAEDNGKSRTTDDSSKKKSGSGDSDSSSSKRSSTKKKSTTTNSGKGDTSAGSGSDRNQNAGKAPLYSEKEAEDLSSELVAKRVCQGFLPTETEKELKKNKTTYEAIAKNYAKGWPASKRDEAYKGCLRGLKARKVKD